MKFTKMHGCGNDYVYVNCMEKMLEDPDKVSRFVSARHFGVGSDGLILICPSEVADCEMAMYNADGSRGEMCGNGVRCVGKYMYDYGLTDKEAISVETLAGIKYLQFFIENGKVAKVRVDMGSPILTPAEIPVVAVVHGGTIMAVLSSLTGGEYFDFQVKNGEGYETVLEWIQGRWKITSLTKIGCKGSKSEYLQ